MPNHIHGIIIIDNHNMSKDEIMNNSFSNCRDVASNVSTPLSKNNVSIVSSDINDISKAMSEISPKKGSLSAIIRSYKSAVTRWGKQNGYDSFAWQPRFYEHIIRNDDSINQIREYIINNPIKWSEDKNNPVNSG